MSDLISIEPLTFYLSRAQVGKIVKQATGKKIVFKKFKQRCHRCTGTGIYSRQHGVCWRCGGNGIDPVEENRRHVAAEDFEAAKAAIAAAEQAHMEREQARVAECQRQWEAKQAAKAEEEARAQAQREVAQKPLLESVQDIEQGLRATGKAFACSLADSLVQADIWGRGVPLAAELAAKGILGKDRVSKAVRELAEEIEGRINAFQEAWRALQ